MSDQPTLPPMTFKADLRPGELVLLDGRVRPEIQELVEIARDCLRIQETYHLTPARAGLVARMLGHAREHGKLNFVHCSIDYCSVCGRSGGMGGRRKNKQLPISGFDCDTAFVRIMRYAALGGCTECLQDILPAATFELANVRAEIPSQFTTASAPRWKKWLRCVCTACGWSGHEGQLGKLPAIMQGYYRGKCPSCGAENKPLGATIIKTDSTAFEIVPVSEDVTVTTEAAP